MELSAPRTLTAACLAFPPALATAAWIALLLAEFGLFGPALPVAALTLSWPVLTLLLRTRIAHDRPLPPLVAALLIAVGSFALTTPPGEILLGGWDPGVYVQTAAAVSRQGGLKLVETDLPGLAASPRRDLVSRLNNGILEPFPGMRVLPDGRISPQFYHLYPCLMAVPWSLGGARAAWMLNPLLAACSIVAFYLLASRLLTPWWGVAAALVLATNPAQIWQAKFSTAEMLTQFLLLSGAALFAEAMRRRESPLPPLLAGLLLGAALLTRYDTILFAVPFLLILAASAAGGAHPRQTLLTLTPFLILSGHAYLHQRFVAPFYQPLGSSVTWVLAIAAVILLLLLLLPTTPAAPVVARFMARWSGGVRIVAAGLFGLWCLFAWFVRPPLATGGLAAETLRQLLGHDSRAFALLAGRESGNMLYLQDLMGALGLALALTGVLLLIATRRENWATAWVAASAGVLGLLTLTVFHDHFLMWVARRFEPVVIPLLCAGVAASGAFVSGALPRGKAAGAILVGAALFLNLPGTVTMARESDWPGLLTWYDRVEQAIPAGAAVYSDQPGVAAALRFIGGRKAYEMPRKTPERTTELVDHLRRNAAQGGEILLLTDTRFADPRARGLDLRGEFPLRSSDLSQRLRGLPKGSRPRVAELRLYRVLPLSGESPR
jgi:hypothetical protein